MDVGKESGKAAPDPRAGGEACVLFKRASPTALWGVLIQGIRECCQIDRLPSSYFGRAVLKYWLGQ